MNARLRPDEQKMTALKFVAIPDAFDDQRMMNLLVVCVYEGLSLWRDEKKSEWASKQVCIHTIIVLGVGSSVFVKFQDQI